MSHLFFLDISCVGETWQQQLRGSLSAFYHDNLVASDNKTGDAFI